MPLWVAFLGWVVGPALAVLFPYAWRWANLRRALIVEAKGTLALAVDVKKDLTETVAAANAVNRAVSQGDDLPTGCFDELSCGWVVSAPKVDFLETLSWLPTEHDGEVVAQYLDRWVRFMEYEKRYTAYLDRLLVAVDQRPSDGRKYSREAQEQASRIAGIAEILLGLLGDLERLAAEIQQGNFNAVPWPRARRGTAK